MVTWFAVHPTSMNNTNQLISGDNKGWASLIVERHFNGKHVMPGQGQFVAAFSAANLGDVSPNIKGKHCFVLFLLYKERNISQAPFLPFHCCFFTVRSSLHQHRVAM